MITAPENPPQTENNEKTDEQNPAPTQPDLVNEPEACSSIVESSEEENEELIIVRNGTRKIVNKSAYRKLHKLPENSESRLSRSSLKKYEEASENGEKFPVPKPRTKLTKNAAQKEVLDEIEYVPCVIRSESVDTIDTIERELSNFVMDHNTNNKSKEKKRTNSFRKLFSVPFFGKDKKKKEKSYQDRINHSTSQSQSDNVDNYQNETNCNSFVRNTPQRHTINCDHFKKHNVQYQQENIKRAEEDPPPELMRRYAHQHIDRFNKIRQSFEKPKDEHKTENSDFNKSQPPAPCSISKYIDTSSSTSTLESNKQSTYQNALVAQAEIQHMQVSLHRNSSLKRDTPPRAQDTRQTVNIVKPKAKLPISSNRPLPNPTHYEVDESMQESKQFAGPQLSEIYGTVFDAVADRNNTNFRAINSKNPSPSPAPRISRSSPSPSLENSKLKLPVNREVLSSQPRTLRSPLTTSRVSPEKIIATEILKNHNSSLLKIHEAIDESPIANSTPENTKNTMSRYDEFNNIDKMKDLSLDDDTCNNRNTILTNETNSPRSTLRTSSRSTITTSPLPHVNTSTLTSSEVASSSHSHPSPDVEMRQKLGSKFGPPSPSKDDIRRSVEAYYWKEIKKIKEQEDYEIYMSQLEFSHAGFAEDPRGRRSRAVYENRNRRSSSVPRNARQQLSFDSNPRSQRGYLIRGNQPIVFESRDGIYGYLPQKISSVPQSKDATLYKPIFRRGSLSAPIQQVQTNKKVSFSNSSQSENWPTKNGFTKSPPQRRLERVALAAPLEDDVFLPPQYNSNNIQGPHAIYADYQPRRMYAPEETMRSENMSIYDYNAAARVQLRRPIVNVNSANYSSDSEAIYGRRFRTMSRQEMENLRNSQSKHPHPVTRHESIQLPEPLYGYSNGNGRTNNTNSNSNSILYGSISNNNRYFVPPNNNSNNASIDNANANRISQQNFLRRNGPIIESIYGYRSNGYVASESPYGTTKQITVRNKVCDIYGNIHDVGEVQSAGVLMGQLQMQASPSSPPASHFVRGSRLTSSNNDVLLLRRHNNNNDPVYVSGNRGISGITMQSRGAPVRPLPPLPLPPSGKNRSDNNNIRNTDKTNVTKSKKKK